MPLPQASDYEGFGTLFEYCLLLEASMSPLAKLGTVSKLDVDSTLQAQSVRLCSLPFTM